MTGGSFCDNLAGSGDGFSTGLRGVFTHLQFSTPGLSSLAL